ncbi:MAG: ParA family protein [Gammaproteobacteria bacterium]|nr:ParA family protein [Gammaproteobacteria bacterium]
MASPHNRAIVLSVVNHKGGVGKTTTVINLAHALVRYGKRQHRDYRVLVIDSDPQSNATSILFPNVQDITRAPTLANVYNERNPLSITQVITRTEIMNLDLIPSSISLFDVEPNLNVSGLGAQALRIAMFDDALLEHTEDGAFNYDLVLIDTPPNLGVFMLNSLMVSDFYLIPIDCGSYFALEGMQTLESRIQQLKKICKNLRLLGYLPTILDNRTKVGQASLSRLRDLYREMIMETTIGINTDLEKASFSRKTIFDYNAMSKGAVHYYALAREVARKCIETKPGNHTDIEEDEDLPAHESEQEALAV